MNKVVYVPSHFRPVGKEVTVKVPTGEKKKGLFGGQKDVMRKEQRWQQTGWSDSEIDAKRLASDLASVVADLNHEGYEVSSVTPVASGNYDYNYRYKEGGGGSGTHGHSTPIHGAFGFGYGYGYSYTSALLVVTQKAG